MQILINSLHCYWIELLCSPRDHNLGITHFATYHKDIVKIVVWSVYGFVLYIERKSGDLRGQGKGIANPFNFVMC